MEWSQLRKVWNYALTYCGVLSILITKMTWCFWRVIIREKRDTFVECNEETGEKLVIFVGQHKDRLLYDDLLL